MTSGRVILLGATGLLGQAFHAELTTAGTTVKGVARRGTDISMDLSNKDELRRCLDNYDPATIINTAGLVDLKKCEQDPDLAHRINAGVAGAAAEWCRDHGRSLLHISTDHYFTGAGPAAHDETVEVQLVNEYARSKFAGEESATICDGSLIVRTNITGWRGWAGRPTFIEWAVNALRTEREVTGYTDYYASTIDAPTLSRAALLLLEKGASGIYNVGTSDVVSKWRFLTILADRLEGATAAIVEGVTPDQEFKRATNLGLDSSRAEALLGWALPDTQAAIDTLLSCAPKGDTC